MATTETVQEVRAEAKWVRVSARKARLVLEHIRGRSVPEARTVLAFSATSSASFAQRLPTPRTTTVSPATSSSSAPPMRTRARP